MWKTIRIPLPGGTLKIKQHDQLRKREQKRVVPVWKLGKFYVIWWPSSLK
jgi:hypothetical protein